MSTGGVTAHRFAARVKEAEDPAVKSLRIKVNTLKRNLKDFEFAQKEVSREAARLETIKAVDLDRVKQQENVLSEAKMMVPHSANRIREALKDLRDFLASEELKGVENEQVQLAHETLESGESALSGV